MLCICETIRSNIILVRTSHNRGATFQGIVYGLFVRSSNLEIWQSDAIRVTYMELQQTGT